MRKTLLIAILLSGLLAHAFSQDKIITMNYDTIDSKITKISQNTLFFDVSTEGKKSSGTFHPDSVLDFNKSGKTIQVEQEPIVTDSFKRLRIGMNGGFGYLLGSTKKAEDYLITQGLTPGQAESYYKDLLSGFSAGADITYLIEPAYGAGIKYKFFSTSGSIEGFFDPNDGVNLIYTTYSENIYVNFVGASFFYKQRIKKIARLSYTTVCSVGLATYRNEAEYLNGYYLITGNNIGIDISIGLEYHIKHYLSVVSDLSTFYSTLRKVKISDGSTTSTVKLEKGSYEDLSRLDFSFGIRFYLWTQ